MAEGTRCWNTMLDALPSAVLMLGPGGNILRQNPAADQLRAQHDSWPPLPVLTLLEGSTQNTWHIWSNGQRFQVSVTREAPGYWLTLSRIHLPISEHGLSFVLDSSGVVLYQSEAVTKMGLNLRGMALPELLDEADQEDLLLALAQGHGRHLSLYLTDAQGQLRQLFANLEDRRKDQAFGGLYLSCQEHALNHLLQTQIRQLERRFLRLLEGIPTAVVIDEAESGTRYINSRARTLFEELGVPLTDAARWLRYGPMASPSAPRMPTERAHRGETGSIDNLEVLHRGKKTVLELSAAPVKARDGGIMYVVTTMRPITEKRLLEARLNRLERMDAVGLLAGELAHDFNNFLHAIASFGRIALDGLPANHSVRQDIEEILHISHRASALTRQLLTVSRRQPMNLRPISLNDTIQASRDLLLQMVGEGIQVHIQLEPLLWTVQADKGMIERILINLLVNARDAMSGEGIISLRTERVLHNVESASTIPEAVPGAYGVLVVQDSGAGITPDVLSHIFEPFFTTKQSGKGTGLGLSMVYGVTRQMGGYIQVRSQLDRGTEFRVALPRAVVQTAVSTNAAAVQSTRKKVLLVDDDENVRKSVVQTLTRNQILVDAVDCAEAGQELFQRTPDAFDALVIDLDLPGMSGLEFAFWVQEIRLEVPMLFISGRTPDGTMPGRFLGKPFNPSVLIDTLRRMTGSRRP